MNSASNKPAYSAKKFLSLTFPALEAQLVYSALELGLFTQLEDWTDWNSLADSQVLDPRNTKLLLDALTSCEYLEAQDGRYRNLPESTYFLAQNSDLYLGDQILYWKRMTDISDLTDLVRYGDPHSDTRNPYGADFFDFYAMGRGMTNVMYTGRVQVFISLVRKLYRQQDAFSVLDLGCGSGVFSIEIARNFPNAKLTLFDQPQLAPLIEENLRKFKVQSSCSLRLGDFVQDSLGGPYDFIIASGIMDFVGDLEQMAKKLAGSLSDHGYLFVSTHGINDDFTGPRRTILGWLSSRLHGLDILKTHKEIYNALLNGGFVEQVTDDGSDDILFVKNAPTVGDKDTVV